MRNPVRPVAAAALVVALTATACSGSGPDEKTPGTDASASQQPSADAAVATKATLGKITGKLPKKERAHLKKAVATVVDGWFDAAFTAGYYPRGDFHDAFPGFTAGAKKDATKDRRLMSNADIGKHIDAVEVAKRRLRIDVLAVHRKPVAVTARVILDFATSGKLSKHLQVKGRLFLTRNADGWRIFGYDVTKGGTR